MSIAHWASPKALEAYRAAYADSMKLWPIAYEQREVESPFGTTHIIVSGVASGEPVVLLHAASLSATQWYLQAAALGAQHRLYALDIMGDIGLSRPARPIRTRADAADWMVGVLDGLGLERPVFVGSSFGGFHAANVAVRRAERVGALVLLAPAATIKPFKPLANLFIRTGSLVPLPFTVRPGLRGMMDGGLPHTRIVRQMEVGVAGFRYDRAGIYPVEISDAELSGVTCPTLLVVGEHERIYDPAEAIGRARRLIPHLVTESLPGAGHLPGMQLPDLVNARMTSFVSELRREWPAREVMLENESITGAYPPPFRPTAAKARDVEVSV